MNKKEKLELVFDFISDYLSEDKVEDKVENKDYTITEKEDKYKKVEDKYKRAYTIMKKLESIDDEDVSLKNALNQIKSIKKEIDKTFLESKLKESELLKDEFTNKTGVTLDKDGKLVTVKVDNLRDYVPISEVMDDIGPSLNEIREQDMEKSIAKGKKLKSVLNDAKSLLDK
jgi:hypothetical protein